MTGTTVVHIDQYDFPDIVKIPHKTRKKKREEAVKCQTKKTAIFCNDEANNCHVDEFH